MKMNSKSKTRSPKIIRIVGVTVHRLEAEEETADIWRRSKLLKTREKNAWRYSRL